jgi:16S rRNA (cytidine1402-2'-O)-methyltransferase|tara:strand:+ start:142 stop:1005 length:864 start_codon:yes stop_codon:yes gene_type:complete
MIIKSQSQIKDNENGLYLVSTPIGNLKDITYRAIETLKKSSYILCEDTRVSKNLLDKYEIKSKLISNHKFNEKKNLDKIIDLLKLGQTISLISDAGTPSISDPGAILVNECVKNNIQIIPIPGPSAVATAVSISGFSEKFFFYGFLPDKKQALLNDFKKFSNIDGSFVFFISPKKINKIIPELKKNFSGRKIVFCREISKLYEEYIRKNVDDLELFTKEPKGELTVVISEKKDDKNTSQELSESDKVIINKMIKKLSVKEIVSFINHNRSISKKEIYNYCLRLKDEK